jgi:hypothetical protein
MFRNALQWRMIPQEYRIQNRVLYDVDARKFGALFVTRVPGGLLFKSAAEGGTSIAFVPESDATKKMMEELRLDDHPGSDEKSALEKYQRQTFGLQESGAEALEVEEWLLRFHDEVQPNETDRRLAGHALLSALEQLNGKNGIKVQREPTAYMSPLVAIAGEGPVTVQLETEEFFVMDATGKNKKKVNLVYDPVSKSYRGPATQGRRGAPGLQVLVQAAWDVIQKSKNNK